MARALCPAHMIWPRICSRARRNDLISPSCSAGSFGSGLKSGLLDVGFHYGGRFPPHFFRRGATQELKISGPDDTKIKGSGRWMGMVSRAYEDTQMTDALKISRLVAPASLSDSEGDPDTPANKAFAGSIRKRLKPFPARDPNHRPSILTVGTGLRGCSISREALLAGIYKSYCYPEGIPRVNIPAAPLTSVGSCVWGDLYPMIR